MLLTAQRLIFENKARAAVSWIEDIYRGDTDLPWVLDPSAVADLPDETIEQLQLQVAQEASVLQAQLADANLVTDPAQVAELVQEYYVQQLDKAKEAIDAAYEKMPESPAVIALKKAVDDAIK